MDYKDETQTEVKATTSLNRQPYSRVIANIPLNDDGSVSYVFAVRENAVLTMWQIRGDDNQKLYGWHMSEPDNLVDVYDRLIERTFPYLNGSTIKPAELAQIVIKLHNEFARYAIRKEGLTDGP